MRESRYLRLALMFGNNNATTFGKNLEKMIALVLYDRYGEHLTVVSIIEELKNNYGLDFSEAEILETIFSKRQRCIIRISENRDHSFDTYSITPKEKARIDNKIANTMIQDAISLFLKENPEIETTAEEFEIVLKRYFYSVFNSNATTISELLDQKTSSELKDDIKFSDEEKEQINSFLEWNNTDKDKCVYQMVSCCFDYCMMTVKRDKNVYQNIFRQKKFYLDTNIIFRMMGLNRENRKKLIDTFIRKCKDAGIELLYTNHTRVEINNTIDFRVSEIKKLMQLKEPISVESVRSMTSKYFNLSFYEAYADWCKDPSNRVGDYVSFSNDLKRQANHILSVFTQKDFDDYRLIMAEEFSKYCESLKSFKAVRRGYARDEIVQTDVNNYMFIRFRNEQEKASDFFGTHNYLISADHILGKWAREQRPGAVPIVVLPSVWYSLILQYTGRADDDFASFTRFLNFSLVSYDDEDNPIKLEILKKVISLDESREIKERTIYDIEQRLSTDYKDFDSVDIIVETSHEYIIDQERDRITAEVQKEADLRLASKEADLKAVSKKLDLIQAELAQEKARHAQAELEATKENMKLLKNIDDAKEEGAKERAEQLADDRLGTTIILYWIIAASFMLGVVYFSLVFIEKISKGEWTWLPVVYESSPAIVDALVGIVLSVGGFVVYKKLLCELDKEQIRNRLIERFSK